MTRQQIRIYTDGACSGNPGPGGWAAIVVDWSGPRELSGGFARTTNNRMELYSVIAALEAVADTAGTIMVTSDSRYVVDMINQGHAERWRQNGWMRDKNHLAQNSDLWKRLMPLCLERDVQFAWVKGHDGHAENERVDQLAVEACGKPDLPVDEGFINPPLSPSGGLFG